MDLLNSIYRSVGYDSSSAHLHIRIDSDIVNRAMTSQSSSVTSGAVYKEFAHFSSDCMFPLNVPVFSHMWENEMNVELE